MKAQGTVRGILVEGSDGEEYLLGFSSAGPGKTPVFSRRRVDGTFEPMEDLAEASRIAAKQLGTGPRLIGPGMGKELWLWMAFQEALKTFPPVPSWPTWPS